MVGANKAGCTWTRKYFVVVSFITVFWNSKSLFQAFFYFYIFFYMCAHFFLFLCGRNVFVLNGTVDNFWKINDLRASKNVEPDFNSGQTLVVE